MTFVLGNPYDDGLGIRLGVSAGGATKHMDQIFITAAAYPPSILLTGIIVNKLGERFVTDDSYHSRTSGFVMDQPDSAAFLIVDEAHMERPQLPLIRFIDGWETAEEMEKALGIPEGKLVATLNRYNEHAARGEDPDFHKQPDFLAPQDKGPWGAFDLSLGKAMYSGFTVGGLATSVDGEVCARTAVWCPVCTPRGRARRTSRRTARATPVARSSVRVRSLAAAPAPTRPHCASAGTSPTRPRRHWPSPSNCRWCS